MKKRIYIICSVRDASPEYRKKLENYTHKLEKEGHLVHLPHRDTNQNNDSLRICTENETAIRSSDEVHIFYNPNSQGSYFDLGIAFTLNKKLIIVENEESPYNQLTIQKSFSNMIIQWAMSNNKK